MFILKRLKTLQHVSIIIQIIFREPACFLNFIHQLTQFYIQ